MKPRLLLIGHAGIPTGFARVLDAIASRLSKPFDVHRLAITLPSVEAQSAAPYTLHANPAVAGAPHRLHDPAVLLALLLRLRPALCLILDEPWVCAQRLETIGTLSAPPPVLCYMAADEPALLPHSLMPSLAQANRLIVFTEAARMFTAAAFASSQILPPPLRVIPHGVEAEVFHPSDRGAARAGLFPDLSPDAFLVLNGNRNQPYKRIDLTLSGFARFALGKPPNVKLCLHMASRPRTESTPAWVDRLGIRDRILPSTVASASHPHLPDGGLNLLYNSCDVGINTADREGFGLIAFEHGITGAAQILPALPTLRELWEADALLLGTSPSPSPLLPGRVAPATTAETIADALEQIYTVPDLRERYAISARRRALEPRFQWDVIAAEWTRVLQMALP